MATDLTLGQQVELTVAYQDASGNPAQKPGAVTWTSSAPSIVQVEAESDDTKAQAGSLAEGNATITATSGSITATIAITVAAGAATQGTITAGTPTDAAGQVTPH
jgi:hypothetical protein